MSKDKLKKLMTGFPTFCAPWKCDKNMAKAMGLTKEQMKDKKIMSPPITVQWSVKGFGFGEFTFYNKKVKGKWQVFCNNECCDRAFIKKVLSKMVDDCVLTEH